MAKKSNFNYSSKRDNVERLKEQARAASVPKKPKRSGRSCSPR